MFSVRLKLLFVTLFIAVNCVSADHYKTVETLNGLVRGVQNKTLLKGVSFYAFKGIPYAKPPIGDLRFKAPEPVESWKPVILDALEHGNTCIQPGKLMPNPFPQSEDCLTLNIYIPANVNSDEKLAVMIFIHGGGYAEGASNDYYFGPDFIIEKQTILVTMNYRLGLLGFMSLDSIEYSGNMGLKDQQLALKWISSNIGQFGGDNKRITVFGESAGGALTHFHVLSAESRNYFRNAISMSGVVSNYWALSESADHLELAYKIANDLGEPKTTYEELVEFFKFAPAEKLIEYSTAVKYSPLLQIVFNPVIERKDAIQPFLTEPPEEAYETSKVDIDMLFTVTSAEMIVFLPLLPTLNELLQKGFNLPLPFRGLTISTDSEAYRNLTSQIRQFYFNEANGDSGTLQKYVAMLSDMNFGFGINEAVQTHADKSSGKAYYYRFSVDSKLNVMKHLNSDVANITGASHADDLPYVFRSGMAESIYGEIKNKNDVECKVSLQTLDYVTKIMTNFAKYGEPSHHGDPIDGFQPVTGGEINFLDINNNGLRLSRDPNKDAYELWASIEKQARQFSPDLHKHDRDEL